MSARVLDNKRLNKQRIECKQIYNVLTDPTRVGWRNHPAVLMWKGYTDSLVDYWSCVELECRHRGFKRLPVPDLTAPTVVEPKWLGDERLHLSHRLNLLWKDPDFYGPCFLEPTPKSKPDYFWPTKEGY
jgi:hypothetical protein